MSETMWVALPCSFKLDLLPHYIQSVLGKRHIQSQNYLNGYGQLEQVIRA